MNTDRTTNAPLNARPHLSEETLSEFASGRLNAAERAAALRHADTCAHCAGALRDYMAMTSALKSLPAPRPRRTFQLTEAQARAKTRRWTIPSLLPTLPALRVATIAVALLLLVVAGADRLTRPGGNSSNPRDFAAVIATAPAIPSTTTNANVDVIAPTDQTSGAGSGRIDSGAAAESESEQTTTAHETATVEAPAEVGAAAPAPNSASGGAGETSSGFSQAAVAKAVVSPEPIATPAPSATATAPATASPTPEPIATPVAPAASTSNDDSSRTGWRIAELGLAMLLLWLIVSYVGVRRTSRGESGR